MSVSSWTGTAIDWERELSALKVQLSSVFRRSETIAVAIHLKDTDVVGDAIKQRSGETLRSQGYRPFVKWQIAGDEGGTPFVALRYQLEE